MSHRCGAGWQPARDPEGAPDYRRCPVPTRQLADCQSAAAYQAAPQSLCPSACPLGFSWDFAGGTPIPTESKNHPGIQHDMSHRCGAGWQPARDPEGAPDYRRCPVPTRQLADCQSAAAYQAAPQSLCPSACPLGFSWDFAGGTPIPTESKNHPGIQHDMSRRCGAGWQPARDPEGAPDYRRCPVPTRQLADCQSAAAYQAAPQSLCPSACPLGFSWDFAGGTPIPTDNRRRWSVLHGRDAPTHELVALQGGGDLKPCGNLARASTNAVGA